MSEMEAALTALQKQVEILELKVSNLRTGEQVHKFETVTIREGLKAVTVAVPTEELAGLSPAERVAIAKLHRLQHGLMRVTNPIAGGSILEWAAQEIAALRTLLAANRACHAGDETTVPQDGGQWECGDDEIRAAAALRIIIDNKISDRHAMEDVETLIYSAGKRFAEQIIQDEVPF